MAETEKASEVSAPPRPTITLPPRSSFETLFTGGTGFSPGPMTLVSNFFSEHYPDSDCQSFSQLLAGAMASPLAKPSFLVDNSLNSFSKEVNYGDGIEKSLGFKQNRPMSLVVSPSPMFLIPPGMSPSVFLNSPGFFSPVQSPFGMSHQQALAHVTAQAALSQQSYMHIQAGYQLSSLANSAEASTEQPLSASQEHQSSAPSATLEQMHTALSEPESSKMEASEVSQSDRKIQPASLAIDKPASDGYNWRKYGQKQVKASEYPRSYYKCTHLNCSVKKKVERSLDGQITEITYKGQHNHELPRPNKRSKNGGDLDKNNSHLKAELGFQGGMDMSCSNATAPSDSISRKDQVSNQLTSKQLPRSSDCEEIDDAERVLNEGDADEPNSKRRNTDVGASELASSHKTITESRIIVQTKSEVDLLDDGYKWRKYGQKVVKGNSHPRSYYRCTYTGCNVRKHVERASTDPKAVITTYEGKHNHDAPVARNSNHNTANVQVVARKPPALHKEMDFGNKDQRPVILQLKEEQITA